MLKRLPLGELKVQKAGFRENNHIVVCMHYYPRFYKKENFDEYQGSMSPQKDLLDELKTIERKIKDHNLAFDKVHFEKEFTLSPLGMEQLKRLSDLASKKDVTLVCQCKSGEKCHIDLLLLLAKHLFHARTERVIIPYPDFQRRLKHHEFSDH